MSWRRNSQDFSVPCTVDTNEKTHRNRRPDNYFREAGRLISLLMMTAIALVQCTMDEWTDGKYCAGYSHYRKIYVFLHHRFTRIHVCMYGKVACVSHRILRASPPGRHRLAERRRLQARHMLPLCPYRLLIQETTRLLIQEPRCDAAVA